VRRELLWLPRWRQSQAVSCSRALPPGCVPGWAGREGFAGKKERNKMNEAIKHLENANWGHVQYIFKISQQAKV